MAKNILVTGGAGYIGSHTIVELINAGYEVLIVDDLSNSRLEVLEGIENITGIYPSFINIDLKNEVAVRSLFHENQIDAVIHFAANKAVGESVSNPLLYYKNNILSMINVLNSMNEFGVQAFVFSSSCTVYGQPDVLPVTESTPIQPAISPYGNTKQIGEEIIQDSVNASDLSAISLRYFNPIGAHDSGLIGELPQGIPANLVPYLLKVVAGELQELSVFGGDYDTKDGTCVRDYIHVVDLAKAHLIAVERLLGSKTAQNYEVFNLGTGEGYTVLDLINTFEEATGKSIAYKIVDRRPGDIEKIYADTSYANNVLGWKAKRDLKDMLSTAWKWQQHLSELV